MKAGNEESETAAGMPGELLTYPPRLGMHCTLFLDRVYCRRIKKYGERKGAE